MSIQRPTQTSEDVYVLTYHHLSQTHPNKLFLSRCNKYRGLELRDQLVIGIKGLRSVYVS